ncbi:MAG: FG-GAP-like repeat-containing protein [Lentisphaeria bacterium]
MSLSKRWITKGFEAFRRGTFGNGGQNLYVSKAGILQRIFQYDLNQDGYFDLVFANCQNHHEAAPSYVYTVSGQRQELPGQGALCGMAVALTDRGYKDLVVTGYYDMAAPFASTDIYFGSAAGYSENRHIRIPTPYAEDCCHGDFNGSGKPALVFAMPTYHTVRVFYQTELGIEWARYVDLPIDCNLITACDLDGDGFDELIVRKNDSTMTTIYWGGNDGLCENCCTILPELPANEILQAEEEKTLQSEMEKKFDAPRLLQAVTWKKRSCFTLSTGKKMLFYGSSPQRKIECVLELEVPMALAVAVGDINGDGYEDLAVACRVRNPQDKLKQCSFIYWGGPEDFSLQRCTPLDTQQACDIDISKRKEDGTADVLFCQSSVGKTYTNHALLFKGGKKGIQSTPLEFTGEDSRRACFVENPGMETQIFLVNHYSRSSVGFDKTFIYWGSKQGYSPENRLEVPSWCAVDALYADLDDDGWAELLVCNNSENSLHLDPGHHIHHFGPDGFEPGRSYTLKTDLGWGSVAGDFNHDGYLELITVCNHWKDLRIFYGGPDGFSRHEDISLDGKGSPRWIYAADLNQNGWLDLIVPLISAERSLILWGGPEGFSIQRCTELAIYRGACARVADLTGNGYPDLLIGTHTETPRNGELIAHHPHHSYLHIYWNGPDGISENNKTVLRTDACDAISVADFNNDGWLDVFCCSYHGGKDRDVNSFLYWNRNGAFHALDRQLLYTHSASGCIAADFNEDGYVDLAVANHKVDGDHLGFSSVWWNGPDGFNRNNRVDLPTTGPHGMTSCEPGNALTRGAEEFYESEPCQAESEVLAARARVEANIPAKTWVKIKLRAASSKEQLAKTEWCLPETFTCKKDAWIQYQLILGATNSLRTPRIEKVVIELDYAS